MFERPRAGERAVLVRLGLGSAVNPQDLEEFEQLARSAGAQPVGTITGRRERPESKYFVGTGKAAEIARKAGLKITRNFVGSYITSLEMAGTSITLLKLDATLTKLWDAPVHTPALRWGV